MTNDLVEVVVTVGDDTRHRHFVGRVAQTLFRLAEAGDNGITSYENPAPRLSHYILRLRQDGVAISTIDEPHAGPYPGRHGRYVLDVPVTVLSVVRAGDQISGRAA